MEVTVFVLSACIGAIAGAILGALWIIDGGKKCDQCPFKKEVDK